MIAKRRHLRWLLVLAIWLAYPDLPAGAADLTNSATGNDDTVTVLAWSPGVGGGYSDDDAESYSDCGNVSLVLATFLTGVADWLETDIDVATPSPIAWRTCTRTSDAQEVSWITGLAGAAEAEVNVLDLLIQQAHATIPIGLPDVSTSPPRGGTQLVGLPIWFWLNNHHTVSTTASIPTLSATLTATPGDMTVKLGDGLTFKCTAGGRRYDPNIGHGSQESSCARAYNRHGNYTVSVTVPWTLAWTATNGQTGTLPATSRTTTFNLDVQQGQAVTD